MKCVPFAPNKKVEKTAGSSWSLTITWPAANTLECGSSVDFYKIYRDERLIFPVSNYLTTSPVLVTPLSTGGNVEVEIVSKNDGFVYISIHKSTSFIGNSKPSVVDVTGPSAKMENCGGAASRTSVVGGVSKILTLSDCNVDVSNTYFLNVYVENVDNNLSKGLSFGDGELWKPVQINNLQVLKVHSKRVKFYKLHLKRVKFYKPHSNRLKFYKLHSKRVKFCRL
jgi:hypothetical protein